MNSPHRESAPPRSSAGRKALPRGRRLTSSRAIRETYEQRRRWVGRCMVLWLRQGDDAGQRLAVVASRKVGKAVARNRAKRRLREVFRNSGLAPGKTEDVVLVARHAILETPWEQVTAEYRRLALRAGFAETAPPAREPSPSC